MTEPMGIQGGMSLRTQILVITMGIAMLLFVLNMVRRRQLREQYSLLWLLSAGVIIVCALLVEQVDRLAHLVGIYYPPAFLFLVAIVLVLVLQFHFSAVISNLREQNKNLTQDLGILATEVRELRKTLAERSGGS